MEKVILPEHSVNTRTLYVQKGRGRKRGVGDDAPNKFVLVGYVCMCTTAFSSCLETARGIETGLKSRLNVAVLSRLLVACQRIYSITTKKFEDF